MKKLPNIIDGVRRYEEKNHIHYIMTNGSLYNFVRFIGVLASVYTVIINFLLIVSSLMVNNAVGRMYISTSSFVCLVVSTAILIAGTVLLFTRLRSAACVMQLIALIGTYYVASYEYQGELLSATFLYRHLIPLAILALCVTLMLIIALIEHINFSRSYRVFITKLYDKYLRENGDCATDEGWSDYLKNYSVKSKNKEKNIPKCPTCGSKNVRPILGLDRAASVLAWGLSSDSMGKTYECLNCKHKW